MVFSPEEIIQQNWARFTAGGSSNLRNDGSFQCGGGFNYDGKIVTKQERSVLTAAFAESKEAIGGLS